MADYKFGKRAAVCSESERPFEPGDVIVSAIFEQPEGDGEGFLRKDMHLDCFEKLAQRPFCHWRTVHPEPPEAPHRLDYDLALEFFDKLVREADPAREGLVYTLALLLSRKRRVRIKETLTLPEGQLLRVLVRRAEEDELVSVRAPRLEPERVDAIQGELEQLFGIESASEA